MFRRHGFTHSLKQRVFDALLERQQGRCFICGISQAEIQEQGMKRRHPARCTLHIDHCHTTGKIRGLLCEGCNYILGQIENSGLYAYYSTPAYQYKPLNREQRELRDWLIQDHDNWLDRHRDILLLYMQPERWLPRKDILFHLLAR
jgi:Recombination endonuclease VII